MHKEKESSCFGLPAVLSRLLFRKAARAADLADPRREAIYEERCEWINEFNKHNKELGFVLGMNRQFADRLPEEIDALSQGLVDNDKNDVLQTSQRTKGIPLDHDRLARPPKIQKGWTRSPV